MFLRSVWTRAVPWTGCVVALGLGLRLFHYLRNPSLWHDEAALVLNVLDKGFVDPLGPLSFAEAAPPLFLWIEKVIALFLGDGTYALRLIPFLASCAALLVMVPIAQRVLRAPAVPWALLLFACSDHILWHSCEAKPYAVDVLAATALLALFCGTDSWGLTWRLVGCGLLAPVLIFLVYPGCFLCGGLLVALLPAVWKTRQWQAWLGYGLLALVIFAAFTLLLAGPVHAQRCEAIIDCWKGAFPSWDRPWSVPGWTVLSSLEVFRYCFEPVGQVLLLLAIAGAVSFWRRGLRTLLALLLVPIALPLIAAFLHAYPYGGSRVLVYVTPALALLIAEGLPIRRSATAQERDRVAALNKDRVPTDRRSRALALARSCALALLLVPFAWAVHRVVNPWNRADCAGAAGYVLAHRRPSEVVAGNHWEYAYYFRELGPAFTLLGEPPAAFEDRLWLVATAANPADRLEVLHHLRPGGWQTLEQRDFTRTSVFLLSRTSH